MKFTLTIELGNDAILTNYDLLDAVNSVAGKMAKRFSGDGEPEAMGPVKVYDANGNVVGHWEIGE